MKIAVFMCFVLWMVCVAGSKHANDAADEAKTKETECNDDDAKMVNCKNGGTCFKLKIDDEKTGFTCHCPSGYSGPYCDQGSSHSAKLSKKGSDMTEECNGDDTKMAICKNGGTCFKLNFGHGKTGFGCHCPSGFSGPRCVNRNV